jgi:integrase/recombinase XerD
MLDSLRFFFYPSARRFTMGQLRDRMEQDLKLKGVSPATIRNYLVYCRKFAAFYMRSPEELGAAEVRAFLLHQIEVAALKFLYSVTLAAPAKSAAFLFPSVSPAGCLKS